MFAAAISLVGLAATVYLVLREAKAIRAQSGTVTKSAFAWSVAFGLFQLFFLHLPMRYGNADAGENSLQLSSDIVNIINPVMEKKYLSATAYLPGNSIAY